MGYRGRFAPSPTGRIHLGNARSALLGWLDARAQHGAFLLRIEDLDRARCRPAFVDTLYRDLEYLGLDWDEPPIFQSERDGLYTDALTKLSAAGRTYPCFCSRAEIARAASAPHGPLDEGPVYPGTCRDLVDAKIPTGRPPAIRFMALPGETSFEDLLHGHYGHDVARDVGDFVIRRNDFVASYQLAVVVDDAATGITHVLRGDDLLPSTPRQLQLYGALGLSPPRFAHVPLLLGEDGKRMAKREGASAIAELRERKVPAARVIGLLAKWSGIGDGAPVTAAELSRSFSLKDVSREPTVITERELTELLA